MTQPTPPFHGMTGFEQAPAPQHAAPAFNFRNWRIGAFAVGVTALAGGLILEYTPFYGGHTVPQVNAVCSGVVGAFLQGMARAFGTSKQASDVASGCSLATTAEHFIGPLIALGVLGLAAGLLLVILERNGATS